MGTLRAEFARKKNEIKTNWRAVANRNEQFALPKLMIEFLERQLRLKKEHWFDLCPLEPRWQSGHHFDVLEDPWPRAMLLCCPPNALVKAAMARTVIEYLDGQDIIFVAHEHLIDGYLERTFVRKLAMKKHFGSPVLEPYKTNADKSYAIYLFLQPETLYRSQIFGSQRELHVGIKAAFDNEVLLNAQKHAETTKDMAVRMYWNDVKMQHLRTFLKLHQYSRADMVRDAQAYADRGYMNLPRQLQ